MSCLVEKCERDYLDVYQQTRGGFDFDNCDRNIMLTQKLTGKTHFPAAKKTGTTICGVVVKDAVVIAADTRATAGSIVADKNADKLHHITENIQCAGAGTSADLTATTDLMARQMELHRLSTGTEVRVVTVVQRLKQMLFRYQGHIGCALVLGGVDVTGPHLFQIAPHGSTDKLPYATMGSGSLAAMSVLETRYKENMTIQEGTDLVADAISAGVFNDLGSGGNIDVCVITRNQNGKTVKTHTRAHREPNKRKYQAKYASFAKGTTPTLSESFKKFIKVEDGNTLDADGDTKM